MSPVGFLLVCGGEQTDHLNERQKDRIHNDVRTLLEDTEYIDLFAYPDFTDRIGNVEIKNVTSEDLTPTGPTSAERFRFIVNFQVGLIKSSSV